MAVEPALGQEREFTDAQLEESQRLMEETPRIEAALKNFLSLKLAEGLTPDTAVETTAPNTERNAATSAASLQGCARVLLKTLNSLELPKAPEWGARHPQGEDEPSLEYLTRLSTYKVVQFLWAKCLSANQKPAKCLGKESLKYALAEAMSQIRTDIGVSAASAKATEDELQLFLDGFELALKHDASDVASDAALVWSSDLRIALAARQHARKLEADERVAREKSAEAFSSELRATLSGNVAPNSSVQIEEVAE